MNVMFWIDIAALCSSAIVAIGLIPTVLGTGLRRSLNQAFSVFVAMEGYWAITSLLLRLSLWLGVESPALLLEMAALGLVLMSIALLAFAARYVGRAGRGSDIGCLIGLGLAAALALLLFQHRVVAAPRLLANGALNYEFTPLGIVLTVVPVGYLAWSLWLFWSKRHRAEEPYFRFSVLIILLGLLIGGILNLPLPILSITNTVGVFLIGFGVISRQLFNPLREREARLRVLNRIADAVGGTLEIDTLVETVYQQVTPLFRTDAFYLALYDEDTDELNFRLQVDEGIREVPERQQLGSGLSSWIIRNRKPLLIDDFDHLPEGVPVPQLYGTMKMPLSWLGVPMLARDRVLGVICIQTYQYRSYGEEEQLLLSTIAEQVAAAVQNARLYEAVARELAEHRKTEQSLKESEEQFRNLAEQSPNMIFINRGGRVVYANRECERVMGYTRDEFYGERFDFLSLIDPKDAGQVEAAFARHTAGEEVLPYEYTLVTKTNQRLDAIITTKLINYGNQPALLGIITDITARKRTERFLQALNSASEAMEQAESPEDIFSGAGERFKQLGVYLVVFLLENGRRLKLHYTSYEPEILQRLADLAGLNFGEIYLPLTESGVLEQIVGERQTIFSTAQESLQRHFPQLQFGTTDSIVELLRITKAISAPLVSEDRVVGMLSVQSRNLGPEDTAAIMAFANQMAGAWRKTRLMEHLKESLDELQATQEQLIQAQKMEAVGKLAGGIAHDFNNLLTAIKGFTELLLQRTDSADEMHDDLMGIKNASDQAARLTRQLLAFSRKQVLQPKTINLTEIINKMREMLQRLIGEHIELVVKTEADLHAVRADPGQIEQIILNLAVNARDAMPDGGTLTLGTRNVSVTEKRTRMKLAVDAGEYVVLSVRDTGNGMDEETRRRLFEPFFTTKDTGKGTGLGLATVYGIVRQSNGTILVDSSPGKGTIFTIYLPRQAEETAPQAAAKKVREELRGGETVLLVEDEQMVRQLAERVLRGYGYNVLVASRGSEALELAERHGERIQMMITDVIMPGGMNGKQLADRLAKICPEMKVLYISGYSDGSLFSEAERGDSFQFLEKPFSPVELMQKVRIVLNSG